MSKSFVMALAAFGIFTVAVQTGYADNSCGVAGIRSMATANRPTSCSGR